MIHITWENPKNKQTKKRFAQLHHTLLLFYWPCIDTFYHITFLQSDHGSEYIRKHFQDFLKERI
jgi:hypothetical protein